MSLPATLAISLALLLGTMARAQPLPARERRERTVTLTGDPAEPPHEIRVAKSVATVLLFKSRINREGIEVDRTQVTIVDAGDRSVVFEPLIDLGSAERLILSVPFADGQRAVFALVSHVSELDTRIDVVRREQTIEACQAELAETQERCSKSSPARFARAGWLTSTGVTARPIIKCIGSIPTTSGLRCTTGTAYRAEAWALVDMIILNELGPAPWTPREATVRGMKSGVVLTVRAVDLDIARIGPAKTGRVIVEMDPPSIEEAFTLELRDSAGRSITVSGVNLSARKDTR